MADVNQKLAKEIFRELQDGFRNQPNILSLSQADKVKISTWLSESPFQEYILGRKPPKDPVAHARLLVNKLSDSTNPLKKAEKLASSGHRWTFLALHRLGAKRTLADARIDLFDEGQQFIKDGKALQNELAAVNILGSARDTNQLVDVLRDFHRQYSIAEREFSKLPREGGYKNWITHPIKRYKQTMVPRDYEKAVEFLRLHDIRKVLVDKVNRLQPGIVVPNIDRIANTVREGNAVLGSVLPHGVPGGLLGALLDGERYEPPVYQALAPRTTQIASIKNNMAKLVKDKEPVLRKLEEEAKAIYAKVASSTRKIPIGKVPIGDVSASLYLDKIKKTNAHIVQSIEREAGTAGILSAVNELDNIEAAVGQEARAIGETVEAEVKTAAREVASEANAAKSEVKEAARTTTSVAENIGETKEKAASFFKDTKGGIRVGRVAMVAGATALGGYLLFGGKGKDQSHAARVSPQVRNLTAEPGAAHRA